MYIYIATNTVNGKQYVGQTVRTVSRRWKAHLTAAMRGEIECRALYGALRKYEAAAFTVVGLRFSSQSELDGMERLLIARLNTIVPHGYNLESGGRTNQILHESSIERQRAAMRGRKMSDEARARMSAAHKGRPKSKEHAQRIGDALRGRPVAKWRADKLRAANTGRKRSPEANAKIVASQIGRKLTAETKAKIASAARERGQKSRLASQGVAA